MASISGSVTLSGDPVDWIACAFDADTHAYAGSAAVADDAYEITGLTAGKAYMVACRPKTGGAWQADYGDYDPGDYCVPTDPMTTPYCYKAESSQTGDEYWADVVLLLRCNGSQGGNTFTDDAGHAATAQGNAITDQSIKKYGTASMKLDGTGDYVAVADSADFDIALNEDVTIEAWFYVTDVTANRSIIQLPGTSLRLLIQTTGPKLWFYTSGGAAQSAGTVTTNAWHHAAAVRSSGVWRAWLDGVAGSTASHANLYQPTGINVGRSSDHSGEDFYGYLDDVRVTIGVARYTGTASFTPPVEEFKASAMVPTGSTEPEWPTTVDVTVEDGGVVWACKGHMVQPLLQGPLIAA